MTLIYHQREELYMTIRTNENKEARLERYREELKELYRKVDRKLDQIARITNQIR